jgi:peroxiredoxin Q/BCP
VAGVSRDDALATTVVSLLEEGRGVPDLGVTEPCSCGHPSRSYALGIDRKADMAPSEGDPAPDFTLESDSGAPLTLSDLRGGPVVLYFYPKDDTPGCTTEACEFRDSIPDFSAVGARVLGVSPDTVAKHGKFRDKHGLNFTLLSDPEHEVAEAYGVWVEKKMYGRNYMGVERSTFVIDADGRVSHALRKVKPKGHAKAVAELLSE